MSFQPFLVAELSANHNGSLDTALKIIDAAASAGADAVKLQTFTPDAMVADRSYTIQGGPWAGRGLHALYKEAQTPWDWHPALFERIRARGMVPMSSPFDAKAVAFLNNLGCEVFKIASFEIVDLELIRAAAATGKPVYISTGMASLEEIQHAVTAAGEPTLLHCVSAYPSQIKDANLATMVDMAIKFNVSVGLSDHSPGHTSAVAATALGASVIEKHLTLSRKDGGLDSGFSMEPDEFAAMVEACRQTAKTIGEPHYGVKPGEGGSTVFRRSLYYAQDLEAGTVIKPHHLRTARPALGLNPIHRDAVIGRTLVHSVKANEPVKVKHGTTQ